MKVNITITDKPISGYYNLNAEAGDDIANMNGNVSDSEAKEILATDVINFIPFEQVGGLIETWIKKLRHKGTIVVGGIEIQEVCKAVAQKAINIHEFNSLIHNGRQSQIAMEDLVNLLSNQGLIILKKRINEFNMVVEAQRP